MEKVFSVVDIGPNAENKEEVFESTFQLYSCFLFLVFFVDIIIEFTCPLH